MLKMYTLVSDFSLCTPIEVGGRTVNIVFSGGCKAMRQNGEFSTADEQLQSAIEGSSGYGVVYKLSKTFGGPARMAAKEARVSEESGLQEKVCRTVNEAIEWLVSLGCRKSDVLTSVKAVAAARELGYELKFEKSE